MAKKILTLLLAAALSLCTVSQTALAEELVNKQLIREKPVNVLTYTQETFDFGFEIFARLAKTMDPVGLFAEKEGIGGVKVSLIEHFLHEKLYLTGGWTLKNKEPSHALLGIELKLDLKGDLGRAISKFKPGIYWSKDKWWFGISLELRETKPHLVN